MRREEERLREKRDNGAPALRVNHREIPQQPWSWPQVWPRRQKLPQQWAQAGPVPMEGVERMNAVMVCSNQRVEFA